MSNQFDFNGKHVLITGGSQGIGRAVAEQMLYGGASVHIWSKHRNSVEAAVTAMSKTYGEEIGGERVDVGNPEEVAQATVRVREWFGDRLDALVCCAGVFGPAKSFLDYSDKEWDEVLRVNLTGTFLTCRALVPLMLAHGGRVVTMASVIGRDASNPMAPAYSAAKAGVIRFTQCLGRDLAKRGVLVNCVAPSAIAGTSLFKDTPQAQVDAMLAKVPMGRLGTVYEVARLICWLASEEMSYSTGAVFDCSGGRHE